MIRLRALCLAGAVLCAAVPPAVARPRPAADPYAAIDAAIQTHVRKLAGNGGAAITISRNGVVVHRAGFNGATSASLFELASVSKTLTAIAALRLVQDGKLQLDAPIATMLAGDAPLPGSTTDPRFGQITLRMLLDHSAGFKRTYPRARDAANLDELARIAKSVPLQSAPGTVSVYSNFGYGLVGTLVQRASGMPYEDYVKQVVLTPAGVTDASLRASSGLLPNQVMPYLKNGRPQTQDSPGTDAGAAGLAPAGGWVASPDDLVKVMIALQQGVLLQPATRALMFAPPVPPLRPRSNGSAFGLGWDNVERHPNGTLTYAKNGGLPGTSTEIQHLPGGIDYAIFINHGEGGVHQVQAQINQILGSPTAIAPGDENGD